MQAFCIDDLFNHITLSELQGWPGNPRVVFSSSQAMRDSDSYRTVLWQLDTASETVPRQLTTDVFSASSPALAPDGRNVAFLSARAGDTRQVQLLPLDGGEARQVGGSQRELQALMQWSPDGRRVLLSARTPWSVDADDATDGSNRPWVVTHLPWKLDGSGPQVGHRTVLLAMDVDSGDEQILVCGDFDVVEAAWSPDGKSLAYVRTRDGSQRHRMDLWLADGDGGNARLLADGLASIAGITWSPDGRTLALGGTVTEGDSLSLLWLVDIADGSLRRPADELQLEGSTIVWHPDGDRVATIAARRGLQEVVVVDVSSGAVTRVDDGLQHAAALCAAGDGLVFVAARVERPDELHATTWSPGTERVLTRLNRDWAENRAAPRVDKRSFQVPDGNGGSEEIDAWVLLPAEGEGPFPLLVDFHGGPQSHVLIDFASHVYGYDLLSHGWAIVAANTVGSGSYGARFAERLNGHWGELDLPQHLAVVEALQAERIAGEQLACTGKSYGGYLTAWAIGHDGRFARAGISAPVINMESHSGTSDSGYYVDPYSMDGEVDDAHERYRRLSPLSYADDIRTPTLLLQGEDDQRCPLGQSEELLARLVRRSKAPARMVVYPGGTHLLAGTGTPSHRVDYHRRLSRWLRGALD